jgi:hypothetical protein
VLGVKDVPVPRDDPVGTHVDEDDEAYQLTVAMFGPE